MEVSPGVIAAQVQGSRPKPYLVAVALTIPGEGQWSSVLTAMRAKAGFVARLLDGEVLADLEEVFADAGVALFPSAWAEFRAKCTFPDWESPCKHIAAVLYVLADRLDRDPWLVLAIRGRDREVLLEALAGGGPHASGGETQVAPWWPFAGGPIAVDYQPVGPPRRPTIRSARRRARLLGAPRRRYWIVDLR